jgi:hypothetical protein
MEINSIILDHYKLINQIWEDTLLKIIKEFQITMYRSSGIFSIKFIISYLPDKTTNELTCLLDEFICESDPTHDAEIVEEIKESIIKALPFFKEYIGNYNAYEFEVNLFGKPTINLINYARK